MRAELTKLASLRSTTWTLLATVVGTLLVTIFATNDPSPSGAGRAQGFDPTNQSLPGLAIGSLDDRGARGPDDHRRVRQRDDPLVAGGHPATTACFSAPKSSSSPAISLVVSEILSFACFFAGQAILSDKAPSASLGQPGVLRALILSGAFLALWRCSVWASGVIIRHTAGAIAAFVGCRLPPPRPPANAVGGR